MFSQLSERLHISSNFIRQKANQLHGICVYLGAKMILSSLINSSFEELGRHMRYKHVVPRFFHFCITTFAQS